MPRTARLVIPGYPHHVTQRGARKLMTFFSDFDYKMYIDILSVVKKKAGVEVWAYCLMPNHVHLIVVPETKDSLAIFFREAHKTFARRINKRQGWQGHLWQERFHSFVMDEEHLLAAVRYIELNPVRAGLCGHPDGWSWSSFHAHMSRADDKLVTVAPMLERIVDWSRYLSCDTSERLLATLRSHTKSGRPVGNDGFIREVERISGRKLARRRSGPNAAAD